eukprot:scaffold121876_cov32-Tisochrysis_lutea.AAC.1
MFFDRCQRPYDGTRRRTRHHDLDSTPTRKHLPTASPPSKAIVEISPHPGATSIAPKMEASERGFLATGSAG